jgi:DNA invertase Pin-like site-specific DNA recombinase
MNVVAYLRVSTDGQVDGWGLPVQRDAINEWAARAGHRVIGEYRDEGVSGTTDAVDRDGLSAALHDERAEGLVIARLDRLARALTVQEAILATAWRGGLTVFTADLDEIHRDDPDDPMRTAFRQVLGVFAELDRANTVKRLRDGRRVKAAAGGKGVGTYGYGQSKQGPVPDEQHVIAHVRRLRAEDMTWAQIADDLNDRGPRWAPRNVPRWEPQNTRKVFFRQ